LPQTAPLSRHWWRGIFSQHCPKMDAREHLRSRRCLSGKSRRTSKHRLSFEAYSGHQRAKSANNPF